MVKEDELEYFLSKINFESSFLDAKAIKIMNDLPFTIREANRMTEVLMEAKKMINLTLSDNIIEDLNATLDWIYKNI